MFDERKIHSNTLLRPEQYYGYYIKWLTIIFAPVGLWRPKCETVLVNGAGQLQRGNEIKNEANFLYNTAQVEKEGDVNLHSHIQPQRIAVEKPSDMILYIQGFLFQPYYWNWWIKDMLNSRNIRLVIGWKHVAILTD